MSTKRSNVSRSSYGRLVVATIANPIGNLRHVSFDSHLTPQGVTAITALLHDECPDVNDYKVTESHVDVYYDIRRRPVEELIESTLGVIERDARQTPTVLFVDSNPRPINNRPSYVNQAPVRSPFNSPGR